MKFSKEQLDQVRKVADVADLKSVRPITMLARLVGDAPPPGARLTLRIDARVIVESGADAFRILASFKVEPCNEGAAEPFLRLRYEVLLHYVLSAPVADADIELFASSNTLVHAWPYLRAWVQSVCGQLELIPLTLPPYRFGRADIPIKVERASREGAHETTTGSNR